jgi:predicted Zn-dependent protease
MTQKELDEKELLEILELAKEAEQKARKMCETITANTAKYKRWYEAKKAAEVAAQK